MSSIFIGLILARTCVLSQVCPTGGAGQFMGSSLPELLPALLAVQADGPQVADAVSGITRSGHAAQLAAQAVEAFPA